MYTYLVFNTILYHILYYIILLFYFFYFFIILFFMLTYQVFITSLYRFLYYVLWWRLLGVRVYKTISRYKSQFLDLFAYPRRLKDNRRNSYFIYYLLKLLIYQYF